MSDRREGDNGELHFPLPSLGSLRPFRYLQEVRKEEFNGKEKGLTAPEEWCTEGAPTCNKRSPLR